MLIKTSIYQEGITIINKYAPNNRAQKYTKQRLTTWKEEIRQFNKNWTSISHFQKGIKELHRR